MMDWPSFAFGVSIGWSLSLTVTTIPWLMRSRRRLKLKALRSRVEGGVALVMSGMNRPDPTCPSCRGSGIRIDAVSRDEANPLLSYELPAGVTDYLSDRVLRPFGSSGPPLRFSLCHCLFETATGDE